MKRVILIVFDSVRQDHLSCYGYGRKTTPNIDKLVEESGSIFDAKVADSLLPGTAYSMYSILSGQTEIKPVKSVCPPLNVERKMIQQKAIPSLFGSNHILLFSGLKWDGGWNYKFLMERYPPLRVPAQHIVDWFWFVEREYESDYPLERPHFSMLWLNDTHSPYVPDDSWKDFIDDNMPIVNIMGDVRLYDPNLLKESGGAPDFKKHMAYYDAAIHNLDNVIAPILQLKDEETLIIVCSDHGDWLGEYGHWFTHGMNLLESEVTLAVSLLRPVFLVMSQPSTYKTATLLDIAPTIATWLSIEPELFWEGKSLL